MGQDGLTPAGPPRKPFVARPLSDMRKWPWANLRVCAGDQLEVHRLKPEARYLGRVRIMEVDGSRAVGERSPHARGTICVGDNVGRVTQRR